MITLRLLRHGPTDAGRRGAPLGRLDWPVNPAGQALWPKVREQLLGLGTQRVFTSDLSRARDHALDLGVPCQVLANLGEQDFGAWDGVPWAEAMGTETFFLDPVAALPPGGESFQQCARRAVAALQDGLEGEAGPVLLLAHGGPLRAILAHYLGLPLARALDLAWEPYGLTRLDLYQNDRGLLRYHNQPLPSSLGSGML